MTAPKILVHDLENSPALGWFYGNTWQTNIAKVESPSRVMSFAAGWAGSSAIEYRSDFHDGHDEMIGRYWQLIDEADVLVSYNGARHDTPHIHTEFLRVAGSLPSPVVECDLYRVIRSRFKFQSNRLDFVLQDLQIGKKIEHEGIDLWLKCLRDDPKAWARFKRYNIGDVRETRKLFTRLLPWIPQSMLPNRRLFGEPDGCPRCGLTGSLQRRGYRYTAVSRFQRFVCLGCGGWSSGGRADARSDVRSIA